MVRQTDDPGIPFARTRGCDRRGFLRAGAGALIAGAAGLSMIECSSTRASLGGTVPADALREQFEKASRPALAGIEALARSDARNGGTAPFPIPWLDKNGSFNQPPGIGNDPSSIFHFKGRIARANGFTGMGTDNQGRRIPFGTITTDYSFMQGEYWAARLARQGTFAHT